MPATPFTTSYNLFGENQDTPRLHLFSSKSSPSGTSEPYLFRRKDVKPSCRNLPQVTFAGILGEDGTKTIGIYVHERNLRGARDHGFNHTVIFNTPHLPQTFTIRDNSPEGGNIAITYLEHTDQTFVLRCGEQIFAMASLGMRIAIFPDVLIPLFTGI